MNQQDVAGRVDAHRKNTIQTLWSWFRQFGHVQDWPRNVRSRQQGNHIQSVRLINRLQADFSQSAHVLHEVDRSQHKCRHHFAHLTWCRRHLHHRRDRVHGWVAISYGRSDGCRRVMVFCGITVNWITYFENNNVNLKSAQYRDESAQAYVYWQQRHKNSSAKYRQTAQRTGDEERSSQQNDAVVACYISQFSPI